MALDNHPAEPDAAQTSSAVSTALPPTEAGA